ncbi:MAG: outer membrane beta-barrel protein [Saprospiraceae bacterium]|nr:outer membrane beta-barrel protein [Saprospiraceae bacterium]
METTFNHFPHYFSFIIIESAATKLIYPAQISIGRLYGKVIDANSKQPLAYATVMILKKLPNNQDTLLAGSLTQDNGDFNISGLPMGPMTVLINYIGNKDIVKKVVISAPNNLEQDIGDVAMESNAQLLTTVEIKAEKVTTSLSLEKRVFNVDKSLTSAGGNAEDILKNVPSITIDSDGNAKLRDKSTTIYVDGKPSLMALNQIPSDQIESIEVISNPSAKYEAATTGGILNIVMKKNQKPGYNGMINLGIGNQDRYIGGLNLNANEGNWNVSGFYNFNTANVHTNGYLYRTNLFNDGNIINYFNQNSNLFFKNTFQTGRLNVDHALNIRNTISVNASFNTGLFNVPVVQNYNYESETRQKTEYGSRQTISENKFLRNSAEAQWKKMYAKKNKSLTTLANYAWGNGSNMANWNTTGFNMEGNMLPGYPELVDIYGENKSNQGVFQIDYINPINDSTKIELGARSFWSTRDQNYFYSPFDYVTNEYILDKEFSQDTRIIERINAAYVTYSGQMKQRIGFQAGLRFEQSSMSGTTRLEGASDFGYAYPKGNIKDLLRSLFPAIYFIKKDRFFN